MNNYRDQRHDSSVGASFFLIIAAAAYCYFVIYDLAGNFKTCDDDKYPHALVCVPEEVNDAKPGE